MGYYIIRKIIEIPYAVTAADREKYGKEAALIRAKME